MRRALLLGLTLWAAAAWGDGIIIPEPTAPHLCIKYHRVETTIDQQAAHTEIDQAFLNKAPRDIEGTYIFPLPRGASFSAFSMFVDGEPLSAEVLDADEARQIYEEIVRQRIDPALLEYVGQGAYRARIFPIPASGEKRVQLAYDELLTLDSGVVRYLYPLNTEKFSPEPLDDVSVTVEIHSAEPLKAIYSPSHPIIVERDSDYHARVIYADEGVTPSEDFVLYYTVAPQPVGVDLLTYMPADEDPGYYMVLAAPSFAPPTDQVIPKRMVFAIDRSGSMAGEQMDQARSALRFAVNSLNVGDQVNIVDYGTTVTAFADSAVTVDAQTRTQLLQYVDDLAASGGTHIHGAMLSSLDMLRGDDRSEMIVFLTDGQPTVGERDLEAILADVATANVHGGRVFVFGVGHEVNTHLLDRLSGQNGGTSTYVEPGEDIEVAVSSFYAKVSSPVMEELRLAFDGGRPSDYYPPELPDLFRGSQVVQLGRLSADGTVAVTLTGQVQGAQEAFQRQVEVGSGGAEFLPRLWATRKVGFLLDEIRLHGEEQELVDSIVELSKRYGIITPYTSFLIVEDELPAPTLADDAFRADSGAGAVAASEAVRDYADADNTAKVRSQAVRYAGVKTFFLRDGVWQDSELDESAPETELGFGTRTYFQVVTQRPELGPYLSLGTEVIFTVAGQTFRVTETETAVERESSAPVPPLSELGQNYPNPFNSSTEIGFYLPVAQPVTLEVYDLSGQHVRGLVGGSIPAGAHTVRWDGRDTDGILVASGVYLYRLRAGARVESRKLMLLQ
jgi:Ca-activated chloride channel homolog